MRLALTSSLPTALHLLIVLLIFVFVLVITAYVTKWIASYQKDKAPGENIVVLEAKRVSNNKLVEIVRIADKCYALGIGKDEITLIGEVDESKLHGASESAGTFSFKDFLKKAKDDGVANNK